MFITSIIIFILSIRAFIKENQTNMSVEDFESLLQKKGVVLITQTGCPACVRAKATLNERDFPFTEINIAQNIEVARYLDYKYGLKGVPAGFVCGKYEPNFGNLDHLVQEVIYQKGM